MDLYSLNTAVLTPEKGPRVPENTLVTVLDWHGEWAHCETVEDHVDGKLVGQSVFRIHCDALDLVDRDN